MFGHPMEYCYNPAMVGICALIQLLCSTDILGEAYFVPHELLE